MMAVEMNATSSEIARAVDDAREDVAATLVDAEPVLGGGAGGRAEVVEQVRVLDVRIRRAGDLDDQRREDRDEHCEHDDAGRDHRDAVTRETAARKAAAAIAR